MSKQSRDRHFPVRPNLEQLRHQAKDWLHALRRGDPAARADFQKHHPRAIPPEKAKLADAQHALARSYGLPSWPRLVVACHMTEAIWCGDLEAVRRLILRDPRLLHESARGLPDSHWGPPLSYAANVGQDAIIDMLRELGAQDVQHAFDRACLQGKIETAQRLSRMGAQPTAASIMGTCETLNHAGLSLLLAMGAALADGDGNRLAPVALLLQTYSRSPDGKHGCLELAARHGIALPDTPAMALHRGRIDLLEQHLRRDPRLAARTFSLLEIYPPEMGCGPDPSFGLHGTPLDGTTLLHQAVEFDELEIGRWLLERGADVNARALVDGDGFGGHTPLFCAVVNNSYLCGRQRDAGFARMLLEHGADPNARASLRKQLHFVPDETMHEYPDVTPLSWGERFHGQRYHDWVSQPALKLIADAGGGR
jgi:ankyrin repeat protein